MNVALGMFFAWVLLLFALFLQPKDNSDDFQLIQNRIGSISKQIDDLVRAAEEQKEFEIYEAKRRRVDEKVRILEGGR